MYGRSIWRHFKHTAKFDFWLLLVIELSKNHLTSLSHDCLTCRTSTTPSSCGRSGLIYVKCPNTASDTQCAFYKWWPNTFKVTHKIWPNTILLVNHTPKIIQLHTKHSPKYKAWMQYVPVKINPLPNKHQPEVHLHWDCLCSEFPGRLEALRTL